MVKAAELYSQVFLFAVNIKADNACCISHLVMFTVNVADTLSSWSGA